MLIYGTTIMPGMTITTTMIGMETDHLRPITPQNVSMHRNQPAVSNAMRFCLAPAVGSFLFAHAV